MESNIHIRWATTNDAQGLAKLNDEFNGVGITEDEIIENLSSSNELVALALINDLPVGFACAQCYKSICYSNPCAEITEMYIKNDARRRGIATLLLAFIEEELEVRGVKSVKVLTGKKNGIAIKTYEKSSYIKKEEQVLQKKL
ncbi:GNAT family N-acetyltransferase [Paenibacillaceae bacterium]|nr:GNAT family N-acetyltransferase [Paenibacillaceae bacterium]